MCTGKSSAIKAFLKMPENSTNVHAYLCKPCAEYLDRNHVILLAFDFPICRVDDICKIMYSTRETCVDKQNCKASWL